MIFDICIYNLYIFVVFVIYHQLFIFEYCSIVHCMAWWRTAKGENLLFGNDGLWKLGDFGSASERTFDLEGADKKAVDSSLQSVFDILTSTLLVIWYLQILIRYFIIRYLTVFTLLLCLCRHCWRPKNLSMAVVRPCTVAKLQKNRCYVPKISASPSIIPFFCDFHISACQSLNFQRFQKLRRCAWWDLYLRIWDNWEWIFLVKFEWKFS